MPAKVFAVIAFLLGLAGASVFLAYVVGTGTGYWPRDEALAVHASYGWNYSLFCLFAVQHSAIHRRSFWLLPAHLERSAYVAASGIVLGIVTLLWQPMPGEVIWSGPIWIVGISVAGAIGIVACARWFDHSTFFGFRQVWTGSAEVRGPLVVKGPYRYVRHPLMVAFLITIWAQPIMPPELLMLDGLLTLYIYVAIHLEERDLLREFGADYEKYRREVPALIPFWRW